MTKPLLEQLIEALQCLPSVGKKSAQRMAYQLLNGRRSKGVLLSDVLKQAMEKIGLCQKCRDYTENEVCSICSNPQRDKQLICVVESPSDIYAIESTASYSGNYFVLQGALSPLDGIGPDEIGLPVLAGIVKQDAVSEIIIATSATVEGEATAHYIKSLVHQINNEIIVSRLAQGVPLGGELEYLDASTLSLSLANRQTI
ncbi:MAG: recombination mediator RecR [Gammaproteobacteria bacterium]|nr:recombination mediator RecR [Gammaproteobacteria bacterium]